jgi:ADP-heptose:LPS heptosyltransferase
MRTLRRLLVLREDKLGDVCVSLSVLEALQKMSPETRVTWLGQSIFRNIVEANPAIEEFWDVSPKMNLIARIRMIRRIRQLKPDAVLMMRNNVSSRWAKVMFYSGIPIRIGAVDFRRRGRRLTSNLFKPELEWRHRHAAQKALDMLEVALEEKVAPTPSKIVMSEQVSKEADETLAGMKLPDRFYILQLGTGGSNREMSPEFFGAIATRIYEEFNLTPVLTGVGAEIVLETRFFQAYRGPAVSAAGKTDVACLAKLASRAVFVLSVDTGTVHVGAAVGTPCVVIMPRLAVVPGHWSPWCVPSVIVRPHSFCEGCSEWKCVAGQDVCVQSISEDETYAGCRTLAIAAGLKSDLRSTTSATQQPLA